MFPYQRRARKAIEKVSSSERRSLSSVIENILYDYVEKKRPARTEEEKRRFPRKKISAPALVTSVDGTVHAGMVNDLSLGGINFSVPIISGRKRATIRRSPFLFTLPKSEKPLSVQCTAKHVRSNGQTNVGATLIDTDFPELPDPTELSRGLTAGNGRPDPYSRKLSSRFLLERCFSFLNAFASICLILSLVRPNTSPTSRVYSPSSRLSPASCV